MILSLLALLLIAFVQADVIDESASLQNVFDEALLDIHGERWSPGIGENLKGARDRFAGMLTGSEVGNSGTLRCRFLIAIPLRRPRLSATCRHDCSMCRLSK